MTLPGGHNKLSIGLLALAVFLFLVALSLAVGWFHGGNHEALVDGGFAALAGGLLVDSF